MKKILAALAFVLFAAAAQAAETCSSSSTYGPQGETPSCVALDSATTNTSSAVINTFGFRNNGVQIWSSAGSAVTVNILCRSYNRGSIVAPWYPCVLGGVINPDSSGQYISLPRSYQYQITTTGYGSGTIFAVFERYTQ